MLHTLPGSDGMNQKGKQKLQQIAQKISVFNGHCHR
jgi:hypothetical protein